MSSVRTGPTRQPSNGAGDAMLIRWFTLALFVGVLILYLLLLTRNYYWDGIFFAQTIEDAPRLNASLLHPNHLFDSVLEYFIYRGVLMAGFNARALTVFQLSNCVFGAAAACLFLRICLDCFKSLYVSVTLTLLFAFSATWWKFCTDADSYILAVLFLLVATHFILPHRKPRPFAVAGMHALAVLVHQLSVFFFPAAVIGIIFQARANGTKRQLVQAIKYLVTVILITVPTYYYSYHLVTGRFSIRGFISWITYFSPENGFTFNAWNNLIYSLRSQARVFLGGRVAFVHELWGPPIVILTAVVIVIVAVFCFKLIRHFNELKTEFAKALSRYAHFRSLSTLCAVWIAPYAIFLFFFIPQNAFYRLFYLPPIILLAGALFSLCESLPNHVRRYRAAALTALVFAANLTFSAYPYALVRANPPTALALKMNSIWKPGTIVYFAARNSDNALVRYFNPAVTWYEAKPETLDTQIRQTGASANPLWLDTTLIDLYEATPEGQRWLEVHTVCPTESELVNRKYKIKFCEIQPATFAR